MPPSAQSVLSVCGLKFFWSKEAHDKKHVSGQIQISAQSLLNDDQKTKWIYVAGIVFFTFPNCSNSFYEAQLCIKSSLAFLLLISMGGIVPATKVVSNCLKSPMGHKLHQTRLLCWIRSEISFSTTTQQQPMSTSPSLSFLAQIRLHQQHGMGSRVSLASIDRARMSLGSHRTSSTTTDRSRKPSWRTHTLGQDGQT